MVSRICWASPGKAESWLGAQYGATDTAPQDQSSVCEASSIKRPEIQQDNNQKLSLTLQRLLVWTEKR